MIAGGHLVTLYRERLTTAAQPAVHDLVRLEYDPWDQSPDLRASFLDGYGRALTHRGITHRRAWPRWMP